jgi:flagellar basal body rod protein FlgC
MHNILNAQRSYESNMGTINKAHAALDTASRLGWS